MLPVFLSLQFGDGLVRWAPLIAIYVLVLAALMVSRVPTMSFKTVRIQREYVFAVLLLVALAVAAISSYPWLTLTVISLAYMSTIPIGMVRYARLARLNPVAAADGVLLDRGREEDPGAPSVKSETDDRR